MSPLLAEMTWPEVRDYLKESDLVLVPCGSTEQHSLHLPFMSDHATAYEAARRVGEKTGAIVTPPLAFGISRQHMTFPGPIALTPATYTAVVIDVAECLFHHGFNRILFVNGHGGNNRVLQEAIRTAWERAGGTKEMAMVHLMSLLFELRPEMKPESGHSDYIETSVMMNIAPHAVHPERANQAPKIEGYYRGELRQKAVGSIGFERGSIFIPQNLGDVCPNGGWGNVDRANKVLGNEILELWSDYLARFITEWKKK
jgi:creatinine amidohydrolase